MGAPGLSLPSATAPASSVAVQEADEEKRTPVVRNKKHRPWGYGCASTDDASDEWSKKRGMANEVPKVVTGMSLEESIYDYIQKWQLVQHGEGVGMTLSDLNRNINHPQKPIGHKSAKKLREKILDMSSLVEDDKKWHGEVVIKIRKQRGYSSPSRRTDFSPSGNCDEILKAVIISLQQRRNDCDPQAARISFQRTDYERLVEDLMAAREALRLGDHES